METRVYECDGKEQGKAKALLENEPYADVSFARQGYKLKEGAGVGGEKGKYYAYMKAEPDFFAWAEKQFAAAEIPSLKRAAKDVEAKVAASIEAEEGAAEVGMGSIFG